MLISILHKYMIILYIIILYTLCLIVLPKLIWHQCRYLWLWQYDLHQFFYRWQNSIKHVLLLYLHTNRWQRSRIRTCTRRTAHTTTQHSRRRCWSILILTQHIRSNIITQYIKSRNVYWNWSSILCTIWYTTKHKPGNHTTHRSASKDLIGNGVVGPEWANTLGRITH